MEILGKERWDCQGGSSPTWWIPRKGEILPPLFGQFWHTHFADFLELNIQLLFGREKIDLINGGGLELEKKLTGKTLLRRANALIVLKKDR